MGEELGGGKLAEGLVRADVVVGVLPGAEVDFEAGDGGGGVRAVVELFPVGAVGTFDSAIEFRTAGREFEEEDTFLLAGIFELGHVLRPTVDLNGADGEGSAGDEFIEGAGCRGGSGVGSDSRHRPTADDIDGRELLEDDARFGPHIHGVDLDDVTGQPGFVALWFAGRVLALPLAASGREAAEGFDKLPGAFEISQDASHPGRADSDALTVEEDDQFELAPGRVALTQVFTALTSSFVQVACLQRFGREVRSSSERRSFGL